MHSARQKTRIGLLVFCLITGIISSPLLGREFTAAEKEAIIKSGVTAEREAYLQTKPYKGITVTITVNRAGKEGATSGPLYMFGELWGEQTGGKVEVIEIPFGEHFEKVWIDSITNTGKYDCFLGGSDWMGDLAGSGYVLPLEEYMEDPRFPQWDPATIPPSLKQVWTWEGKWYIVPNDCDGMILYYRKDVLQNPKYQKEFWDKYGYELPVPPATWEELRDVAEFFNGWDWDEDGSTDYGITMHLKVGGLGVYHFEAMSVPYVISSVNHDMWWFDPETMKPLVNSPGHVEALKMLIELSKQGPGAALSWRLDEAWDCFLRGDAIFCFTWGDLGSLAQDESKSRVRGKLGCAPLPGTLRSYDPRTGEWVGFSKPNIVGNVTSIGCWSAPISKLSKHPEATYDFLAFMTTREANLWNALYGWTGNDIGRTFTFIEPYGPTNISEYTKRGWNPNDAKEYSAAYYKNFYNTSQAPPLRIPGSTSYNSTLDLYISEAVSGGMSPEEALDKVYEEWERITKKLGRTEQIKLYEASLK